MQPRLTDWERQTVCRALQREGEHWEKESDKLQGQTGRAAKARAARERSNRAYALAMRFSRP